MLPIIYFSLWWCLGSMINQLEKRGPPFLREISNMINIKYGFWKKGVCYGIFTLNYAILCSPFKSLAILYRQGVSYALPNDQPMLIRQGSLVAPILLHRQISFPPPPTFLTMISWSYSWHKDSWTWNKGGMRKKGEARGYEEGRGGGGVVSTG